MPDKERGRRANALRQTVEANTIEDWVEAQMEDIEAYRNRSQR
jgi:trehalose 6-phosphate synthase